MTQFKLLLQKPNKDEGCSAFLVKDLIKLFTKTLDNFHSS